MAIRNKWIRRSLMGLAVCGAVVVGAAFFEGWLGRNDGPTAAEPAGGASKPAATAEKPGTGAGKLGAGAAERTVAVSVVPLTVRPVQRAVGAVGTFYGHDEVTVAAQASGRVVKVLHDVGDIVAPGDVLLEIDPVDYELAIEETRRGLELEAARLGVEAPPDEDFDPDKILKIIAQLNIEDLPTVKRAALQRKNAESRLARVTKLGDRGSISQEESEQRATDLDVATTTYLQALLDARAVLAGIKYRLVTLRVSLRKLSFTQVRVPLPTQRERMPEDIKYAVVERKVDEGEMVKDSGGQAADTFELVLDGVLRLKAAVPEKYASQVKLGQKAEVRVDAYPNRVFTGEVVRINPMIDRTSRTFQVEIYLENLQRELKAGGFAKADILTHVDPAAWTVPAESIVSYAGSVKIFVVREGRAHAVPVVTGLEGRGWVELVRDKNSDLRQDDKVITTGQERLAEGVAVIDRGAKQQEEAK